MKIARFLKDTQKMHKKLNFSIESWAAWSSSRSLRSDWINWAQGKPDPANPQAPDVSMLPVMKRRRMSQLSKMAFHTAHSCLGEGDAKPICVFASQHGELNRTVQILDSLVESGEVSPTSFSLSVHNTALGLYSINTQNQSPATTVAAGEDTFGYGLLEASNLLARFKNASVLLVYFDEPIPEPIKSSNFGPEEPISLALLLKASGGDQISFKFQPNLAGEFERKELGESFLKFYLSDDVEGQVNTERTQWYWNKL